MVSSCFESFNGLQADCAVNHVFEYGHYIYNCTYSYTYLINVFLDPSNHNPWLKGDHCWNLDEGPKPNVQHWQVPTKTHEEIVVERQQELDGTSPEVMFFVASSDRNASLTW